MMTRSPMCLLSVPYFKVGDPCPVGYLDWHEWAWVQIKGGLRQVQGKDGKWRFPQEAVYE